MKNKLIVCFVIFLQVNFGTCIPFFGPFRRTTTVPPPPRHYFPEEREPRIINADHGGLGAASLSASYAGGNVAPAPWISGTRDQYILDQLVILHPDSPLNRDAWRESGMLNYEYDPHPKGVNVNVEVSTTTTTTTTTPHPPPPTPSQPQRIRKPHRKSKQHDIQSQPQQQQQDEPEIKSVNGLPHPGGNSPPIGSSSNNANHQATLIPSSGGLFDLHQSPPPFFFRDINQESDDAPVYADPYVLQGNSLFYPVASPIFPYPHQPRATSQYLPPEAVIQLLKNPEQEMSPYSRPQVKLPFPLSHDCSSGGGSGSKPLQFVVLPIVEPVAPLKPLIPKPSFLTSQYGQFPYIPPFNLFKKPPTSPVDGVNGGGSGNSGGPSSGQFVPILNRPAPPLPFVFVQSLPLELIGQNTEMDVIHAPASSTNTETKIKDISSIPVAAPTPIQTPPGTSENQQSLPRPLPLIVIEKVKTPGQPPSSPVAPAAAVVEISKQSVQRNSNNSSPLSTISVVQPITSAPTTLQKQQELQKAIEKLVPVAAAVLENVEQQQQQKQQQQKEQGREKEVVPPPSPPSPLVGSNPAQNPPPIVPTGIKNDQDKTPLRAPLRPEAAQSDEGAIVIGRTSPHKKPDGSEENGASSTANLGDVEVTEA